MLVREEKWFQLALSKVHGSSCMYHPRTIGPGSFTRRPVWTRRASHPAPSGRPPRGGAKVAWFRYSCEYLGYSREDPGRLVSSCSPASRSSTHPPPYCICFVVVKLHYAVVLCGAERVKTIRHERPQCLCFERRSQSRSLAEDAGSTVGTFGYSARPASGRGGSAHRLRARG